MYFTSSSGISQDLLGVRCFIILPGHGARHKRLRRVSTVNPLLMDAKSQDGPIRARRAPGNLREAVA